MIKIQNLTKKIDDRFIFSSLNLEIPSNKVTFVVGESGIGKTTLINLIAGFTKKDGGNISFFDENGSEIKKPLVDVVFQDFNLIEKITSNDNILIGNNVINKLLDKNALNQNANLMSIKTEQLEQKVNNLSGGERQRIAILRSLSRDSSFILLDEPTRNLDIENAKIVFENLTNIAKNKTILVVSHNLDLAKKYADKIVYIEKNKITEEIFNKNSQNQSLIAKNSDLKFQKAAKNSKLSKIKQEFKTGFLLTITDFKSKLTSSILFLLLFLTSFFGTLLFGVLNLNISSTNLQNTIEYQLDSVVVTKKSNAEINTFSTNEITKLKEDNPKIVKIVPIFNFPKLTFAFGDKTEFDSSVDYIDESDFFKNRFIFDNKTLVGRNIQNNDEIIISKSLATKFNIEKPNNQKISVLSFRNTTVDLKVVGISSLSTLDRLNFSFLHHKFFELAKPVQRNNGSNENLDNNKPEKIDPWVLKLYFNIDDDLANNIENFAKNNKEFEIQSFLGGITKSILNTQSFTNIVIGAILVLFIIILLIQTVFYAKNLSDSKMKLIGILKALNAKTWQIFFYHWLNIIIISLFILFINSVVFIPSMGKIYTAIIGQNILLPSLSQVGSLLIIIWLIMFASISVIYLIISWLSYRKPVIKLLKFEQF
ncbi:ABC transporter ATP-binding protein [Mesomycoplasma ovipneumoniae]|uniref:ABC transporter ATP-binding protein n=1 Tax=Mesomycoplasma ovipneumoniae TaxID=29562 RepID=UPI0028AF0123|nr:ABC transporter ATP-binding protein [Mesomycoplasma ovipneumoniae]MDW2909540.1 ABC transporter ATP-binding protein [Mesomycoplasma ovipneumoniae]MDW2912429.1 ABC transporter ATP-binding protein [Mesomycoplasma ovipneumoniae]MDW2914749.1 ABC transporter ATP-binding protein [Mesomycoplasma ovipneumoniae]MDW2917425.1 ABC transporter ATP-binding protein [Mesomycoplasma ovipneumoniae]MDW2925944.1 ABC transporter ATP-binding protein [Mesomycoplasma ovipneumoniae]